MSVSSLKGSPAHIITDDELIKCLNSFFRTLNDWCSILLTCPAHFKGQIEQVVNSLLCFIKRFFSLLSCCMTISIIDYLIFPNKNFEVAMLSICR